MSKFKAKPDLRALPDPDAVAAFAAGAEVRATTPVAIAPPLAIAPPVTAPVVVETIDSEITAPATSARRPRRAAGSVAAEGTAPWERFDRAARPLSGINVRLNDYEHELLKHLAEADARSIQQTIKRLLIPAAEAAARRARRGD